MIQWCEQKDGKRILHFDVAMWPFLFCIRLGNLGKTEPGKLFRNFKWLKNREDGSDFDDFWTKRIAALSAKI